MSKSFIGVGTGTAVLCAAFCGAGESAQVLLQDKAGAAPAGGKTNRHNRRRRNSQVTLHGLQRQFRILGSKNAKGWISERRLESAKLFARIVESTPQEIDEDPF